MSRKILLIVTGVLVVLIAAGALFLTVVAPAGADGADEAMLEHIADRADRGSEKVLAQRDWGDGALVLSAYTDRGVQRLALGFAAKELRGWQVASYTEETVEPDDVKNIGSLLVASSEGGDGQPPWSAAVGQLTDTRVNQVELKWSSGDTGRAATTNDAFLVVQRGATTALEVRYLAEDGTEIAKVPIDEEA